MITMKQSFTLYLLIVGILYSYSLLAYQQQTATPEPHDIEKVVSEMEEYAYAGDFAKAIDMGISVRSEYRQQHDVRKLNFINQELLLFQVLREDIGTEEKEKGIHVFCDEARKNDDPNLEQICQAALAHLMLFSGDTERFEQYYNKAVAIAKKKNDYSTLRILNVNAATEYLMLGEWNPARLYIQRAEKALALEKIPPTPTELGSLHNARCVIYYNTSEYDKALNSALFNVRTLEKSSEDQTIALLYDYNNLASIYTELGEEENAFIYHKKALEILPNTNDYPIVEQAVLYYNASTAYDNLGASEQSLSYAKKALSTLSSIEEKKDFSISNIYVFCYHHLVDFFYKTNNLDSSLYYLDKAEEFLPSSPISYADHYKYKTLLALEKKDYKKATLYADMCQQKSLENYNEKDTRYFNSFVNYINISFEKKNYRKAVYYTQKALETLSIDFIDSKGYSNPSISNIINKKSTVYT